MECNMQEIVLLNQKLESTVSEQNQLHDTSVCKYNEKIRQHKQHVLGKESENEILIQSNSELQAQLQQLIQDNNINTERFKVKVQGYEERVNVLTNQKRELEEQLTQRLNQDCELAQHHLDYEKFVNEELASLFDAEQEREQQLSEIHLLLGNMTK